MTYHVQLACTFNCIHCRTRCTVSRTLYSPLIGLHYTANVCRSPIFLAILESQSAVIPPNQSGHCYPSGNPRTRFAMIFNCTSELPPAMVLALDRNQVLVVICSRSLKLSPAQPKARCPINSSCNSMRQKRRRTARLAFLKTSTLGERKCPLVHGIGEHPRF